MKTVNNLQIFGESSVCVVFSISKLFAFYGQNNTLHHNNECKKIHSFHALCAQFYA